MLDIEHLACIVAVIPHVLFEHEMFVGLEAFDNFNGCEAVDGLAVDIACSGELNSGAH
jgi:hypothetical protein